MPAFRPWLDAVVVGSPAIRQRLVNEFKFPRSVCIPYGIQFAPIHERGVRAAGEPLRLAALAANAARLAREEYSAERAAQRYLDLLAEFPAAAPVWPEKVTVLRPQLVRHGWLYAGLPRHGRRWLKRLV